jgi:hypothetical protein
MYYHSLVYLSHSGVCDSFVLPSSWSTLKCVALACYLVLDTHIATTFLEYWKRQEAEWRCQWGMANYQEKEVERPQFVGEDIRNPIDGKMTKHFPYDIITYLLTMLTNLLFVHHRCRIQKQMAQAMATCML